MSEKLREKRNAFIGWLLKRDTVIIEFGLGVSALINAGRVLSMDDGKPLAPFLFSAVFWLQWAGPWWVACLLLYGTAALTALVIGQLTGNSFLWRCWVSLFGCALWLAAMLAVWSGRQPWLTGAGYGLTVLLAFVTAIVLVAKHDYKTGAHDRPRN